MGAEDRAHACRPGRSREELGREPEVVRVHVALLREGLVGRLAVRPLDETQVPAEREKGLQVFSRPVEVGLDTDADARIRGHHPPVDVEGPVRVGRGLDVDPDPAGESPDALDEREKVLLALLA